MEKDVNDPYHLQRFVDAQRPVFEEYARNYKTAENEVTGCRLFSHELEVWAGAIGHSGLQFRLVTKSKHTWNILSSAPGYESVAGSWPPSMTLLAHVATDNEVFNDCLPKYFAGKADPHTLARLSLTVIARPA